MKRHIANWLFWRASDWVIEGLSYAFPHFIMRIIDWAADHADIRDPWV